MGLFNYCLNRLEDGQPVIQLRARDGWSINSEIKKYAAKGYVLNGNPYSDRTGTWWATMTLAHPEMDVKPVKEPKVIKRENLEQEKQKDIIKYVLIGIVIIVAILVAVL